MVAHESRGMRKDDLLAAEIFQRLDRRRLERDDPSFGGIFFGSPKHHVAGSLILLDEIGRGTSTYDGVSIAWAVVDYLYHRVKAKTLFATHYHVLNKLESSFDRVQNYNIAVKEEKDEIIFLRKLLKGGTDKSFGVYVAKLAGLPEEVVNRAKEVQSELEDKDRLDRIQAKKLEEQKRLF